ncbi:hypothetical protein Hoch_1076 [Haliangium ochraceum DSM 14365]|uniref:Uncharacterized protein n=2 Tax=Haliangium ochraceum TaxID=80816 RepID=D0LQV4_HALO1|nr:hypothetical protein Hoch_1076 [Haliangium ochraceum DSM 14365]
MAVNRIFKRCVIFGRDRHREGRILFVFKNNDNKFKLADMVTANEDQSRTEEGQPAKPAPTARRVGLALFDELRVVHRDTIGDLQALERRLSALEEDIQRKDRDVRLEEEDVLRAHVDTGKDWEAGLEELRKRREQRREDTNAQRSKAADEYRESFESLRAREDDQIRAAWVRFARELGGVLSAAAESGDDATLRAIREDLRWLGSEL